MALEMPVESGVVNYQYEIDLEGRVYQFEYAWNSRGEFFALSIRDEAGADLVAGIPVLLGELLTAQFTELELPPGDLYAWDTSGADVEAALEDFGTRVLLQYEAAA